MHSMVSRVDTIAEFEDFQANILPALRADLKAGLSADEIRKKWESVAAAKMVTLLARADSDSASVAAAKDIQDRVTGRPKERKEIEHRLGKLPDQELDAILLSEMEDVSTEGDSNA